jgi:fibronectin type 3 domain-containing protein
MKKLMVSILLIMLGSVAGFAATVQLAWDRSPDPGVAGYNIYRATMSGGPYTKLNLMLLPQTPVNETPMYSDTTPAGSQLSYYYVVRAQSLGGVESANSNEVVFNPPPTPPTNLRIVSFTTANLLIDGRKVAGGPPFPVVYVLPRQTPPRNVPIQVTVSQD